MNPRQLFKSEFGRNIQIILTGSILSQAILILATPVLTRVYSPSEFGVFAVYIAIATILSSIATGRYDIAMMLPKKDEEAVELAKLAFTITIIFSFMVLVVVVVFKGVISDLLKDQKLSGLLLLLPLSVLLAGLYQVKISWYTRKKNFKKISISRALQNSIMVFFQLMFGLTSFNLPIGLLLGFIIGQLVAIMSLRFDITEISLLPISLKREDHLRVFNRYIKFPKYDVPSALLNISSSQAPNILFSVFFSPIYAGYFLLTQRVLQAPVSLLAFSVLDVFKQRASNDYKKHGNARDIFKKTFYFLLSLSFLPTVLLFFYVEDLFLFVLGPEWMIAGQYAEILIPAMFLRFLASPLSFMLHIAEKQNLNLITQIFLFSSIVIGFFLVQSHVEMIMALSFSYSVYYIVHLILSAKLAGFSLSLKARNS